MTPRLFIYYGLGSAVGSCVTLAVLIAWLFATVKWPITFLAVAVLTLYVRQIIYNDIMKDILKRIVGNEQFPPLTSPVIK